MLFKNPTILFSDGLFIINLLLLILKELTHLPIKSKFNKGNVSFNLKYQDKRSR
jgi:hypothetical protein